jgi:hypothetical protein
MAMTGRALPGRPKGGRLTQKKKKAEEARKKEEKEDSDKEKEVRGK